MKNKIAFVLVLAVCISFLGGCINYSESMTLNRDFSGKVSLKVAISNMLLGMMGEGASSVLKDMEESFKSSDKIKLIDSKTYVEMDNQIFAFDIEFKSIEDLNTIGNNDNALPFIGEVVLVKEKDGTVTLKRVISDKQDIDPEMQSSLAGYNWTYELKTPYKILNANTSPSYIDHQTNTVRWEVPFLSIYSEPQEMTVNMEAFNPLFHIYTIGTALVLLLIVFGVIVIKRKKQMSVNTEEG